jgi:branched-chain amino acid transport system ATP-binding protein
MLEVSGLEARYGRIPALKGIELRVGAGELVALVGANGAGKSTLLRVLSGVQPSSGRIFFEERNLAGTAPEERVALGLVHVPEGRQVFAPLCVEDNLRLGAYRRGRRAWPRSLERVYALFPVLAERRRHAAGTLSGGQQQMLAIGRGLMAEPRLLLLDEPSMGLAPRLVAEIFACIRALRAADTSVLLVEQNARAALAIADRGYVLETGRIALAGTGQALAADPGVRAAYLGL